MDDIDRTDEREAHLLSATIAAARRSAAEIPAGVPGICEECEQESERLVGGRCAPCRDGRKRKAA